MDNNYYNPYTNSNSNTSSTDNTNNSNNMNNNTTGYTQYTTPPRKSSFGTTIAKTIAIALIFGLVAGVAGIAVFSFGGEALGLQVEAGDNQQNTRPDNKPSDKNPIFGELEDNTQADEDKDDSDEKEDAGNVQVDKLPQTDTQENGMIALMDVSELVKKAMPCIVAITNTSEVHYQDLWGQHYSEKSESAGTGFIVEQDNKYLYIATNNHVVAGAKELVVQFADNSEAKAEIKGTVASKDLAVIKVALSDIKAETFEHIRVATLGDSNELQVGQGAIAIGNALGYGQSVTTGVVSALGRSVTVTDGTTGTKIVNNNLIQTDAAINPGNSGGALFNCAGEVIGINSVKYSDTSVEGIGYAIPISDAMLVIDKLISGQQIDESQSGYLGIQGVDSDYGVYVYKVIKGSAAEKAGLSVGDIIVAFEGNEISTMSQLKELLSYYPAGTEVTFGVLKAKGNDYVEQEIKVVLGDASTIQQ